MGIFGRIFGATADVTKDPDIQFGRFSDSYKEEEKYDAWDQALKAYENDDYLVSFKLFLDFLTNDQLSNVDYSEIDGEIDFHFYQGSKMIIGKANSRHVKAEAKIAKMEGEHIGFMRRLMELNFGLKYTRYALDGEGHITLVFDTYMLDGSPYKLYYALKELAVNADKQDDILLNEFSMLKTVNTGHTTITEDSIKKIKYEYLTSSIESTLSTIDSLKLDVQSYPGAVSYLILSCIYRLDFLVKPEGTTLESFEKIHKQFFQKDNLSPEIKNMAIRKEFEKISTIGAEDFYEELYGVKSTFGITAPTPHQRIANFIEGELHNMDWYLENGHHEVAQAIPEYIIGYCLFNYAMPDPDRELMILYYKIIEAPYFKKLGFEANYQADGNLQKKDIIKSIKSIAAKYSDDFPSLNFTTAQLVFDNMPLFAKSFLSGVKELNLDHKKTG